MLKIERTKNFVGMGEGLKRGEYFFGDGLKRTINGIIPAWEIREAINSGNLSDLLLIGFFTQIKLGNNNYIYAVNRTTSASNGKIFSVLLGGSTFTLAHTPTTVSYGNGLITDQKNRLLYLQTQYLGMFDGTTWTDNWKDFGAGSLPSNDTLRPADLYEDWVVMGNGNKVALLNITDDSFNANALNFPSGCVVSAIKSNRTGVLIGLNLGNRSILALWDCSSTRTIAPWLWLDGNILAITNYGNSWIVRVGNKFIITNGYSYQELPPIPGTSLDAYETGNPLPSAIAVKDHYLLVGVNAFGLGRRKAGLWILDFNTQTWEFCHISNKCYYGVSMGGILVAGTSVYIGYATSDPSKYYIGRIYDVYSGGINSSAFVTYISPIMGEGDEEKIAVGALLNLGMYASSVQSAFVTPNPNYTVDLKIYDFKRRLYNSWTTSATSPALNQLKVDGSSRSSIAGQIEVGDEVTICSGANAGEIRHITAIQNRGTANEIWVLDSNLPSLTASNVQLEICPFKKAATQTLNTYTINDFYFNIPHSPQGKKFLLKVVITFPSGLGVVYIPEITGLALVYDVLSRYF